MITQSKKLETFEHEYQHTVHLTMDERYTLMDGMYELSKKFGHFTASPTSDHFNHIFRLAKILGAGV
ncbi:MAG TPA: hypothetical protein VMU30_11630 [Bacteroidota bacterium]|nr:hypothetical protein [Bacteroidota bacterium]